MKNLSPILRALCLMMVLCLTVGCVAVVSAEEEPLQVTMYLGCLDWFFLYADRNFDSIPNFAYAPLFKWLYASGIYFDYRFNFVRSEYSDNFYEADSILQWVAAVSHSACHASDLQNSWNLGAGDRCFCSAGRNAGRKHDCDSGGKI